MKTKIIVSETAYKEDVAQLLTFVEMLQESSDLVLRLTGKIETSIYNAKASLYLYLPCFLKEDGSLKDRIDWPPSHNLWMAEIQVWDRDFMLLEGIELFIAQLERLGIKKGERSIQLYI